MTSSAFDRSARAVYERLRRDAARWVVPEGFADAADVDAARIVRLLVRHRQFRAIAWFRLGDWGHGVRSLRGIGWLAEQGMGRYGLDVPAHTEAEGGLYIAHPAGVAVTAAHLG